MSFLNNSKDSIRKKWCDVSRGQLSSPESLVTNATFGYFLPGVQLMKQNKIVHLSHSVKFGFEPEDYFFNYWKFYQFFVDTNWIN